MKQILLLCFFLFLCSTSNAERSLQRYLWANYQLYRGNLHTASRWYQELIKSHHSCHTYKGYLTFLHRSQRFADIARLTPKLKDVIKDDPDLRLICILSLKKVGQHEQAAHQLIALSQEFKNHFEIAYHATELLIDRKELHNALTIIDNFLNNAPKRNNHFVFYFLKAQLCSQLGKIKEAQENINICIEKQPHLDKVWLLFALIQEQAGSIEQAIKGYTTYFDLSSDRTGDLRKHLMELTVLHKAQQTKKSALTTQVNECVTLLHKKRFSDAFARTEYYLKRDPNDPRLRLCLIQSLLGLDKHQQVVDLLTQWSQEKPYKKEWPATLHLLLQLSVSPELLLPAFEQLIEKGVVDNQLFLYLAEMYMRTNQYRDAMHWYHKALTVIQDRCVVARICYQIARLCYEQEEYDLMQASLKRGQEADAQFAPIHNLLAYYYATKGKDLDKATMHIATALRLCPDNPHMFDTQALIWYKQGNIKQALEAWNHLAQKVPHDATMLTHCAKAHYKMGNTSEARTMLGKATSCCSYHHEQKCCAKLAEQLHEKDTA